MSFRAAKNFLLPLLAPVLLVMTSGCGSSEDSDSSSGGVIRGAAIDSDADKEETKETRIPRWKIQMAKRKAAIEKIATDSEATVVSFYKLASFYYDDGSQGQFLDPHRGYGGASGSFTDSPWDAPDTEVSSADPETTDTEGENPKAANATDDSSELAADASAEESTPSLAAVTEADPEAGSTPAAVEPADSEGEEPVAEVDGSENEEAPSLEGIPEFVRNLNGTRVAIEGYIQPLGMKDGVIPKFLLTGSFGECCFGSMPAVNEWIRVDMPEDKPLETLSYGSVLVVGTLEVGPVKDETGVIESLYRMQGMSVHELN